MTYTLLKPTVGDTSEHTKIVGTKKAIFLAGPCPRDDYEDDWRKDAFKYFDKIGFDGMVITPTNDHYDEKDPSYLMKQTKWEHEAMCKASAIVFWIPRSEKHPGYTTNIEFGEWYAKEGVFTGMPKDAIKNDYLEKRLDMLGIKWYKTLEDTLKAAVDHMGFNKKGEEDVGVFFTADTHFGQERTLELSHRPFVNVEEMDLALISNWNKHVTDYDDVVHGGDVGDWSKMADILSCLNFRTLTIVPGNYDRKDSDIMQTVTTTYCQDQDHMNIFVESRGYEFSHNNVNYKVIHEPLCYETEEGLLELDKDEYDTKPEKNVVYLFGHIHGRAFAKRNGFDLGTDYHRYTPISLDDVEWFNTARAKYWDENVFCENAICKEDE